MLRGCCERLTGGAEATKGEDEVVAGCLISGGKAVPDKECVSSRGVLFALAAANAVLPVGALSRDLHASYCPSGEDLADAKF
jgi:hypothetical protein